MGGLNVWLYQCNEQVMGETENRGREAHFTTPIREGISIAENLYTLTDKGVYLTRLADDIDPERTNINVPNIHKKVLEYGFENRGVLQRVAGQCHDPYLGPEINRGIDSGKLF